jgi:hypothetical protein
MATPHTQLMLAVDAKGRITGASTNAIDASANKAGNFTTSAAVN